MGLMFLLAFEPFGQLDDKWVVGLAEAGAALKQSAPTPACPVRTAWALRVTTPDDMVSSHQLELSAHPRRRFICLLGMTLGAGTGLARRSGILLRGSLFWGHCASPPGGAGLFVHPILEASQLKPKYKIVQAPSPTAKDYKSYACGKNQ